jgi:hypothetical protein
MIPYITWAASTALATQNTMDEWILISDPPEQRAAIESQKAKSSQQAPVLSYIV